MSNERSSAYDMLTWLSHHGAEPSSRKAVILGAYNFVKISVLAEAFQHLYVIDDGKSHYRCSDPVLGEISNDALNARDFKHLHVTRLLASPADAWVRAVIAGPTVVPVEFIFLQYHLSYLPLSSDLIFYSNLPGVRFLGGALFGSSNSDVKRAVLGCLDVPGKIFEDGSWIKQIKP